MGAYRFHVQVRDAGGQAVASDDMTLDPLTFFPSDRMVIAVDARPQIIECAPRQFLYLNETHMAFMIRIREHRVSRCNVQVDIVTREGNTPVAGDTPGSGNGGAPRRFRLHHAFQNQSVPIEGWDDGEYWIRVCTLVNGEAVGPYCVRKFWIQRDELVPPTAPIELRGDLDEYRKQYPNHADPPYFTTWEDDWATGKTTTCLPAAATIKPYRGAHAEPTDTRRTITTRPIRVDGDTLRINASTQRGGSITVRVEDDSGQSLLDEPVRFTGDDVAATVADLSTHGGAAIRIHFDLDRAKLYAFKIAQGQEMIKGKDP